MKKFCIAGPIDPERHYYIPHRLDHNYLEALINDRYYFVFHAPRQSGKTTAVKEFVASINTKHTYDAVYINVESAQAARDNFEKALLAIVELLKTALTKTHPEQVVLIEKLNLMLHEKVITLNYLSNALALWAQHSSKPTVLFIDEIDALIGDSLLSVLRQLRVGYPDRPHDFPQSVCLIGLRDVRDYRIWSKEKDVYVSTSSPFNIKAESLLLSNFTQAEICALYQQHTSDTGQQWTDEAIAYAYDITQGQPWLANALAYQACYRDSIDPVRTITQADLALSKECIVHTL